MTSGFLRKLLGGRPPIPPHLEGPIAELNRLAAQRPSLRGSLELLADVLPELFGEPAVEAAPRVNADAVAAALTAGTPLLRTIPVTFDRPSLERRWRGVCAVVGKHQTGETAAALARAVGDLDLPALLAEVLSGRPAAVHARAETLGLDGSLVATALRLTAYPALARVAAGLAGVRSGTGWDAGFCPTCGSYPLLGEFRGLDQIRWLRCGLCASAWDFPRLRCPFCDNRDHQTLGYFHVEEEQNRYRAATCDACRGYVKMVSTLVALSEVQLLVTDAATLHLDLAAADRGYAVLSER